MTDEQKKCIEKLRTLGRSYRKIALILGLTEAAVKTYCHRKGFDNEWMRQFTAKNSCFCPNCGKPIKRMEKVKPRRFCSDACRMQWWSSNRDIMDRKAFYRQICIGCGKEFLSYGNKNRKYCGRDCYMLSRFGKGDEKDDN